MNKSTIYENRPYLNSEGYADPTAYNAIKSQSEVRKRQEIIIIFLKSEKKRRKKKHSRK